MRKKDSKSMTKLADTTETDNMSLNDTEKVGSENPITSHSCNQLTDDFILDVTCGQNQALLYVSKLQLGSKGTCVLFENAWLTPNEFQYVSGRETAKDWKRSIKHHGKSLKVLIAKGILTTSPPLCACTQCAPSKTKQSPVSRIDGDDTVTESLLRNSTGRPAVENTYCSDDSQDGDTALRSPIISSTVKNDSSTAQTAETKILKTNTDTENDQQKTHAESFKESSNVSKRPHSPGGVTGQEDQGNSKHLLQQDITASQPDAKHVDSRSKSTPVAPIGGFAVKKSSSSGNKMTGDRLEAVKKLKR